MNGKICKVDNCTGSGKLVRGMCRRHYAAAWSRGEFSNKPCNINDCSNKAIYIGLCNTHYSRKRRGIPLDVPIKKLAPKGSGYIDSEGYHRIGNRRAHRIVMEEVLGRPLLSSEDVHHKNGIKLDNSPENLELWIRDQPRGQRSSDLICWAIKILRMYSPNHLKAEFQ